MSFRDRLCVPETAAMPGLSPTIQLEAWSNQAKKIDASVSNETLILESLDPPSPEFEGIQPGISLLVSFYVATVWSKWPTIELAPFKRKLRTIGQIHYG